MAAVLLISIGEERAGSVLRHMREDEAEDLAATISQIAEIEPDEAMTALREAETLLTARRHLRAGGVDFARNVLQRAYGSRADQIMARLRESMVERPFDFARKMEPTQLLPLLRQNGPQTIALVCAHLQPDQCATLLRMLEPELRAEVAWRIAHLGNPRNRVSQEALAEVATTLRAHAAASVEDETTRIGGVEALASILARMLHSDEQQILDAIRQRDAALAEAVEARMFTFDDLAQLDAADLRTLLSAINLGEDLPLALRLAPAPVRDAIFASMTEKMRAEVQEQMEYLPKRLRRKDVEEAQARIVQTARQLEAENRITLRREGEDEISA
jgi:flagellar motor switch protein FliG